MGWFFQIIILLIILASMVMVLLGIRQLAHYEGFDDAEETGHLKEEIIDNDMVLSDSNIFHNLVETEKIKTKQKRDYKSVSKDPLSRKE